MSTLLGKEGSEYQYTETMDCPECGTEVVVDIFLVNGELAYEVEEGLGCPNGCIDCHSGLEYPVEMVADEHGFLPA